MSVISAKPDARGPGFGRYAWGVLLYLVLVIVYGAWVRVTGSGAGCGEHWPTCHGELLPRSPATQTVIEFTHRVTSGLLGPLVIGLVVWAWRARQPKAVVRMSVVTALWVVFEAALGAGLVLKGLVASDASLARAVVVGLHLVNTLILVAAAALTAYWGGGHGRPGLPAMRGPVAIALVLMVLVGLTGAITALGDTLFPVSERASLHHIRAELASGQHFLLQLRVVHPAVAVLAGAYVLWVARRCERSLSGAGRKAGAWTYWFTLVQLGAGVVNIALGAPGWLQLLHLLLAQGVWIALVLLWVSEREAESDGAAGLTPGRE